MDIFTTLIGPMICVVLGEPKQNPPCTILEAPLDNNVLIFVFGNPAKELGDPRKHTGRHAIQVGKKPAKTEKKPTQVGKGAT